MMKMNDADENNDYYYNDNIGNNSYHNGYHGSNDYSFSTYRYLGEVEIFHKKKVLTTKFFCIKTITTMTTKYENLFYLFFNQYILNFYMFFLDK